MNGYGDAHQYYDSFSKKTAITPHFTKIAYSKGMQIKAGDLIVWSSSLNASGAGHIAIATGNYSSSTVETFDQNFPSGSPCKLVKHSYSKILGVLRPKDQSKVTGAIQLVGTGSYPTAVPWKNGSTQETVFSDSALTTVIGTLSAKESAECYSKSGASYLVVYKLDGTSRHKAGFVEYAGGVTKAPPESRTYKNGSTSEIVYADTAKKTVVGSLNAGESCYCLGKIDGMYLVLYSVDDGKKYKCGFAEYNGGL